jgi:hypothetical protein
MRKADVRRWYKGMQLLTKLREICFDEQNYFSAGYEGEKWVAWAMIQPGFEPAFYHVNKKLIADGVAIDDVSEKAFDAMLKLHWVAPKPINALEKLARAGAYSGLPAAARHDISDAQEGDVNRE